MKICIKQLDIQRKNNVSVFINIKEKFNLPQYRSIENESDIIKSEYIIFEIGNKNNYDYNDDYYKRFGYHIFMTANINKMNSKNRRYSKNGHEAVVFRASQGKDVLLYVIGILSKAGDTYFIKPYAIYR